MSSKTPKQAGPGAAGPGNAGPGTTGHEWDGIEEYNNPLPRWWLYIFYACIAFAFGYVIFYPAIPGITGYSTGVLKYSARDEIRRDLAAVEKQRAERLVGLETIALADLPKDPALMAAAVEGGRAAFKLHCVQCHGAGAAGGKGYPNLNDDDWLWGGDMESIHTTLLHGIRHPGDENTRISVMPAFGRDEILSPAEIEAVVEHVRKISGQEAKPALAATGAGIFAAQCAVCHGEAGLGNRELGAPNLADKIWLYGGDRASLTNTIVNARGGVMPAWGDRLSESTIRQLTAYVHSRGGGE